jgi:hypothetical protein
MNTTTTIPFTQLLTWLLKDRHRLRRAIHNPTQGEALLLPLLAITVVTLGAFGAVITFILPFLTHNSPQPAMSLAYVIGFPAALGVCLPSLYFYSLQCGLQPSLRMIVIRCLASQAYTGLLLLGILPVYGAVALAIGIGQVSLAARGTCVAVGLALPFLAGLFGAYELYLGFRELSAALPAEVRARRRGMVVLLAVWSTALYASVVGVLVFRLLLVL